MFARPPHLSGREVPAVDVAATHEFRRDDGKILVWAAVGGVAALAGFAVCVALIAGSDGPPWGMVAIAAVFLFACGHVVWAFVDSGRRPSPVEYVVAPDGIAFGGERVAWTAVEELSSRRDDDGWQIRLRLAPDTPRPSLDGLVSGWALSLGSVIAIPAWKIAADIDLQYATIAAFLDAYGAPGR